VTLLCADGESVTAPASVLASFALLRGLFHCDEYAGGAFIAEPPQLPVTAPQLQMLIALLTADIGRPSTAGIATGVAMLEERYRAPGARGTVAAEPLLHMLLAADKVGAPLALSWAAAVAAARALVRGGCA
jgi:hypothetical protein